jgi:UDP-glucose 4-epimerase
MGHKPDLEMSKRMELHGRTFAVIGGAGFVGSHVVDSLLASDVARVRVLDNFKRGSRLNLDHALKDDRVSVIEGSITDIGTVREVVRGADGVFHLAALWLDECLNDPRSAVEVNIGGTYNVIEACRDEGVTRVVYSSSASVYGNALAVPMTEDHPFNNRTFYGATKIAGEQMFRAFNEVHGLNYVGLRYMNIYGPRMDDKGTYVSVIVKVLDRLDRGERPQIYGDGMQSYDFIHVRDVARANLLAMSSVATDAFYNIGAGVRTTISELVDRILKIAGSDLTPEHHAEGRTFVTHRIGSVVKANDELGFTASVALDDGLRDVVAWWRTAGATARAVTG